MTFNLTITLIVSSLILIVIISSLLVKGRIPEKYAILWYVFTLIIFIVSFFPSIFEKISKVFGFQLMSNMVILLLIGILFLLVISLTIMLAGQKKKTILLIQEVSMLKERNKNEKK